MPTNLGRSRDAALQRVATWALTQTDLRCLLEKDLSFRANKDGQLRAECPFHSGGESRSLRIEPGNARFACAGCGFSGSAIGWMMYYHGLEFVEAVAELATAAGMKAQGPISAEAVAVGSAARRRRLSAIADSWHLNFLSSRTAQAYLERRRILPETAERFRIGYVPSESVRSGRTARRLWRSAVALRRADGTYAQRFAERLVFPITSADGDVVGFGARALDAAREPKYLNSPGARGFDKGELLFGLDQVLQVSAAPCEILVVEGYLDVVSLHQSGIRMAVATLGTALSEAQLRTLLGLTDRLLLCFDPDPAGKAATRKALLRALPMLDEGKRIAVVQLPAGEDPDDTIRLRGKAAFQRAINAAVPLHRWLAMSDYDAVHPARHRPPGSSRRPASRTPLPASEIGARAALAARGRAYSGALLAIDQQHRFAAAFDALVGECVMPVPESSGGALVS